MRQGENGQSHVCNDFDDLQKAAVGLAFTSIPSLGFPTIKAYVLRQSPVNNTANSSPVSVCQPPDFSGTMPSIISTRPQTSRQARRAYQKSGGTIRLSERELRQLERSAELQERADRIKERENKRKANLKKRNERVEKERGARQKMGLASPVKETVGASQMRLGAFKGIGLGLKRNREEFPALKLESTKEKSNGLSTQKSGQRAGPARSPLQPRSLNQATNPPTQNKAQNAQSPKQSPLMSFERQMVTNVVQRSEMSPPKPPKPYMQPPPKPSTSKLPNPTTRRSPSPLMRDSTRPGLLVQDESHRLFVATHQPSAPKPREPSMLPPPTTPTGQLAQPTASVRTRSPDVPTNLPQPPKPSLHVLSMPPLNAKPMQPPPRPTLSDELRSLATSSNTSQTLRQIRAEAPQPSDDGWAAFLVSNTQIERELSTEDVPNGAPAPNPIPLPLPYQKHDFASAKTSIASSLTLSIKPPKDDTAALLTGLCTQDLDYDADPWSDDTKFDPSEAMTSDPSKAAQSFGDDTISDAELEDIARDVEERSSARTANASNEQHGVQETFCDDEFGFSTQELCELVG